MKTILFYDFETNALIDFKKPSEDPSQPHATQLAAELCIEETGEVVGAMNMIIRPDGWTIPLDLQELTGITMERANQFGVPAYDAMIAFIELWRNADVRCAHNETFDARMTRIELMRHEFFMSEMVGALSFADYWKAAPAYCTMSNSISICNVPATEKMRKAGRTGPKSPNLAEAYKHFTGLELEGAHNAQVDIMACRTIYYALKAHNAAA